MINLAKRFRRDESGSVLPVTVVMLVVILGMGALAVDVTRGYAMRDQLQASADAAALAGASLVFNETTARASAVEFGNLNAPAAYPNIMTDADIVFGSWSSSTKTFSPGGANPNAVQATARMVQGNSLRTTLAGALGFGNFDVVASAIATGDNGSTWDVTLVQDITTSFTQELPDAITANQTLLNCINNRARPTSLIGGVAFTGYGHELQPLDELQNNFEATYNAFSNLQKCGTGSMPGCSGTHIGAGMAIALNQFATYDAAHGDDGGGPPSERAMIIVGDGSPNCRSPACTTSTQDLRDQAVALADAADAEGISVFAILYNENHSQNASNFLSSLVRGQGTFHETPDPTKLTDLLEQVCNAQLPLRLVQ